MSTHMAPANERWKEVTALCNGLLKEMDPYDLIRDFNMNSLVGMSQHAVLVTRAAQLLLYASLTQLCELPWAQSLADNDYPRYSPVLACQTLLEACIAANWWQQDRVVLILVAVADALRGSVMEQPLWEYLDYRVDAKGALARIQESGPEVYRKIRREVADDPDS